MMAWNPSPQVAAARDFANQFDAEQVVILYVRPNGQLCYASYGKTKKLCADAKVLADAAYDAVFVEMAK